MAENKKTFKQKWKKYRNFYLYVSPWIIGFSLFTIIPMVFSLITSFTDATALTLFSDNNSFISFDNYKLIFTNDPDFIKSITNTVTYAVFRTIFVIVLSLAMAMLVFKLPCSKLLRTFAYLPSVIPIVGAALIWQLLFDTNASVFNNLLVSIGLNPIEFSSYDNALGSVILMSVWTGIGPTMIIFTAAIAQVPDDLLESAEIDGANKWQKFSKIILPLIIPNILFVAITGMISGLQAYAEMDLLFGGGPGDATITMTMQVVGNMYADSVKGFGYACAQSWVIFLLVMVFTVIFFALNKKYMFYGEEK